MKIYILKARRKIKGCVWKSLLYNSDEDEDYDKDDDTDNTSSFLSIERNSNLLDIQKYLDATLA